MIFSPSVKGHQALSRPDVPMPPSMPVLSISSVLAPSRAAAAAAVQPEGPPPTTITSHPSSRRIRCFFKETVDSFVPRARACPGSRAAASPAAPAYFRNCLRRIMNKDNKKTVRVAGPYRFHGLFRKRDGSFFAIEDVDRILVRLVSRLISQAPAEIRV